MLKRWTAWPAPIRWLAGIAAVVLAAAIVWALFVPLADWLAHHDVGSPTGALHETALDNARGRLLTLGAGLVAGGALVFTALNFNLLRRNSEQTDQWQRRTYELTEQGQVTDRFTKAIEQLGSDKLDVRIGGIYALERIARDSADDHPTVMEVLTAFIREHSPIRLRQPGPDGPDPDLPPPRPDVQAAVKPGPDGPDPDLPPPRPDVQAAVTAVGRRNTSRDTKKRFINLAGADLTNVYLGGALLLDARLIGAVFDGADLADADLTDADLTDADLTGADLIGAKLAHAKLRGADLTDARLIRANLDHANLTGANLTGANLTGAKLTNVDLRDANLTRARLAIDLTKADLTRAGLADIVGEDLADVVLSGADPADAGLIGARLADAGLTRADLTGAMWSAAEPVPEGWMVDGDSGRLKRARQLSAAVPLGGSRIREKIRDGVRRRSLLGSWSCCGAAAARACGFGDDDAGCP